MRNIFILIVLFLTISNIHAFYAFSCSDIASNRDKAYSESIILSNGSVLSGYIAEECLSSDSISVMAYNTVGIVPAADVYMRNVRALSKDSLSDNVSNWLKRNSCAVPDLITLCDIIPTAISKNNPLLLLPNEDMGNDSVVSDSDKTGNLVLLEKGFYLKYYDPVPHLYRITWNDIVSIHRPVVKPENAKTLDTVIVTENGGSNTYVGQLKDQYLGKYRSVLLQNGMIQTVNPSRITALKRKSADKQASVLKTAPLYETLVFEPSTGMESITGVILENNTDQGKIIIMNAIDGDLAEYSYNDIYSIKYSENPESKTNRN